MAGPMTCIPFAVGVPAAGGPPTWWIPEQSPPAPGFNKRIDDPRWHGSVAIGFPANGGGAGEHATFRALHHTTEAEGRHLYLSFWVKVDPALDANIDRLTLGLQGPGSDPLVLRLPAFVATTAAQAGNAPSPNAFRRNAGPPVTWPAEPNVPDWAPLYARNWVVNSPGSNKWALNFRVPLMSEGTWDDNGINLGNVGDTFLMWFELEVRLTSTTKALYKWPAAAAPVSFNASTGSFAFPDPSTWGDFRLSSGPNDPACGPGVRLSPLDIGTTNPVPNEIRYVTTGTPVNNHFFARPENRTGAQIPGNAITARFRLANWGTQPDWNAISDPTQLWTDIRGGGAVQSPNLIANNAKGSLEFDWTLNQAEINQFEGTPGNPPTRSKHNCILVELSGPGLTFINSSVFNNFTFKRASAFKLDAEVSLVGLEALASGRRDTYLYVETTNMPAEIEPGEPTPTPDFREGALMAELLPREEGTIEQIAERYPTYRVHYYYDTGATTQDEDGTKRKIFAPGTSFGYLVGHEGELHGWDATLRPNDPELSGQAFVASEVPNLYRLAIPEGGKVVVTTEVVAHDRPRRDCLSLLPRALAELIRRLLGR